MRALYLLIFGLFVVSSPVFAEAEVGKVFPAVLSLTDQNEEAQSFDSIKGEKGAVLVFVRSADWCPYCQVQLLDLRAEDGEKITGLGYSIVTVSYDAPKLLKKFAVKYKFEHVMLSDKGSEVIKALGILNEDFGPDHFAYGVPNPTVYVVGTDGIVQAILEEETYKRRPQVEAIVEAINEVGQ